MRAGIPVSAFGCSHASSSSAFFSWLAGKTSHYTGKPGSFLLATAIVIVWAITGPIFHYSDTWQLVINTGTTIVTFLMVFLIQNTQNRDTLALQLKLDELILATRGAHNDLAGLEDVPAEELEATKEEVQERTRVACAPKSRGRPSSKRAKLRHA